MSSEQAWPADEFRNKLQSVHGEYHHLHPFHMAMNAGKLNPDQLRGWVANRFYYQRIIPIKDAAILSNCPIREVRRTWIHRIVDHDGTREGEGGIEAWLRLAQACGLTREDVLEERHVLPDVRRAGDTYVYLARTKPWPVAVASSLTELFAPDLMSQRIVAFEKHYQWIPAWGLEYFRSRVPRAKTDSTEAMDLTLQYCNTPALQAEAIEALRTKCQILRDLLDAIMACYGPESIND